MIEFTELRGKTLVFYDGVCGLCNRLVRVLLALDHHDRLRFTPLQTAFSAAVLSRHGIQTSDLNSIMVLGNPGEAAERVHTRSDAILYLARVLGGIYRLVAVSKLIPARFRDGLYDLTARNRYRLFGRHDFCPVPRPEHRKKFIAADM